MVFALLCRWKTRTEEMRRRPIGNLPRKNGEAAIARRFAIYSLGLPSRFAYRKPDL